MKRLTGSHVSQIKTVGELVKALKFIATDDGHLNGTWEVEWFESNVRLRMSYEMDGYE